MQVNQRVRVSPKGAEAPYEGIVSAHGDETIDVESADGTIRSHAIAHVEAIGDAPAPEPVQEAAAMTDPATWDENLTSRDVQVSATAPALSTPRSKPKKKGKR